MAKVYENTKNYQPIRMVAYDENDEIMALVQSVVSNDIGGFIGQFASRSIIQGGPLFVGTDDGISALKILMQNYNKIASKKSIFSEIRNLYDTSNYIILYQDLGFFLNDHLDYILYLDSEERIWNGIHKSMKRSIKKAQNDNLSVVEMTDENSVKLFHDYISEVLISAKIPIPDITLYESIFKHLVKHDLAKLHFATKGGDYLGGKLTLIYKDSLYAHSVGVPEKYKKLNVNAFMTWDIINFGIKNGFKTYYFGGAGNPKSEYGVRDFKRHFGGTKVNYGRYKIIHSKFKNNIAEFGLKLYQTLPGRHKR